MEGGSEEPERTIRLYDPDRDTAGVRRCIVALQEHERSIERELLPGEDIADGYLRHLLAECGRDEGRLFVAQARHEVAGFVAVMARRRSDELDEEPYCYGYVHDLVVLEEHRGGGIGRALLDRARAFVEERGVRCMRLHVLAGNRGAISLYRAAGFRERELLLELALPGDRS